MSRATNDMTAVRMVLGPGIMYTANTVATSVGTLALMARISPRLLGSGAGAPASSSPCSCATSAGASTTASSACRPSSPTVTAVVQENLSGVRVVRAYAQEPHERARFEGPNQEFLRRNRVLIQMFGSLYPGIQLLMGMGAVLVLWWAAAW